MKYVFFGKTGLRVSEVALGTMTFGTERGVGSDLNDSRSIFSEYSDVGGNFLDTANTYTNGTSERMISEFVRGIRHAYVIATKYSLAPPGSDPNASGNHRKSLVRSIEGSLKRLGTDYIDMLWVHAWDKFTPIEETLRALDDLIRQGKILYIGISDTPAWVVSHANVLAELRGWTSFCGIQVEYSLIERTAERDLLPMARQYGLSITAWSPLGGGLLTGKYNSNHASSPRRLDSFKWLQTPDDKNLSISQEVVDIAVEIKCTPAQLALGWIGQTSPDIIPVIGARSAAQLKENLGYLKMNVPEEFVRRLSNKSKIALGFPHDFLASDTAQKQLYGEMMKHF